MSALRVFLLPFSSPSSSHFDISPLCLHNVCLGASLYVCEHSRPPGRCHHGRPVFGHRAQRSVGKRCKTMNGHGGSVQISRRTSACVLLFCDIALPCEPCACFSVQFHVVFLGFMELAGGRAGRRRVDANFHFHGAAKEARDRSPLPRVHPAPVRGP